MIPAAMTKLLRTSLSVLAVYAGLHAATSVATPPPPGLDVMAVETDSSRVIVPADPSGRVSVTTCPTCPAVSLAITSQTEFLIDNRTVAFAEWKAFAGKGYTYGVDAVYATKDKTLLSLTLNSAAKFDAARR